LVLSIGAAATVFSIANALLWRRLPVKSPDRLISISTLLAGPASQESPLTLAMFQQLHGLNDIFEDSFAMRNGGLDGFDVAGQKYAASLTTVSGSYYSTLGIRPARGRFIEPSEVGLESGHSAAVAVLGYRSWRQRYGGDPQVIGKTLRVNGVLLTIVGVAPESFGGFSIEMAEEATAPFGYGTKKADPRTTPTDMVARLRSGVTMERARSRVEAAWPSVLAASIPQQWSAGERERYLKRRPVLRSIATGWASFRTRLAVPLAILTAIVGMILVIACVNLANLMIARDAARYQEFGIRITLGARVWSLIRQSLMESIMLTAVGAILGIAIALRAGGYLVGFLWRGFVPLTLDVSPDWTGVTFTALVSLGCAIFFGVAPVLRALHRDPASVMRSARTTTGKTRVTSLLLVVQAALAIVVTSGAAMLTRSLQHINSDDVGFDHHGILTLMMFPQNGDSAKIADRTSYYGKLAADLSRIPGVESVAYSQVGPASPGVYEVPVETSTLATPPVAAAWDLVGPGFFHTMKMHVLEGREFDWRDDEKTPRKAIVSEGLARRLFPGRSAIGRTIDDGPGPDHKNLEIIGVVNDASLWAVKRRKPIAVYECFLQRAYNESYIDLRSTGDAAALALPARRTLESLGRQYALRTQTLDDRRTMFLAEDRLIALLSSIFGAMALLLSAIGLYGVTFHAVTRRTPEIGIRMAVGAQRSTVFTMILRDVFALVLLGIAVGVPVSIAASRSMASMLFGLSPGDPISMVFSAAALGITALAAAASPARKASSIDPMTALRTE